VIYSNIEKGNSMSPDIIGTSFTVDKMTGSLGEVTIET
jgi:hypothetical protein